MSQISFFIPAYNCATTIEEAVDSIMQTNCADDDELVIVNDCSIDNTSEILRNLKEKYPAITIINHKRNKGGAAARNTAVENAKHGLLFCLDADNVLEQNSIRPLRDFLIAQKAEVASFNELRYFSEDISVIEEVWAFKLYEFTIKDLLSGKLSPGAGGNYMFTKNSWEKARGYSEDLGALDTWSFGFKQLMQNCKMVVMPDSYYFHRRGHESYYIRDAWNRRRSVSLRLIKLIIDYIDLIHPDDVNYIFSKKGRYNWFDNLEKRPVRLIDKGNTEPVWAGHELKKGVIRLAADKVNYYKTRLSQIFNNK
jgi:glycosyltransferase involved in cell wall biosynthesis